MKNFLLAIIATVLLVGSIQHVEARGRRGSHRVGGYTSHGKGSHYFGGF